MSSVRVSLWAFGDASSKTWIYRRATFLLLRLDAAGQVALEADEGEDI